MQARTVRPPGLLSNHLMQAPHDRSSPRQPQRQPQAKGVDRHGVGGGGGVEVVHNPCGQRRKGVVASCARTRADATSAGPIQSLQASLQRRQSVRLRVSVPHMFLYAP